MRPNLIADTSYVEIAGHDKNDQKLLLFVSSAEFLSPSSYQPAVWEMVPNLLARFVVGKLEKLMIKKYSSVFIGINAFRL